MSESSLKFFVKAKNSVAEVVSEFLELLNECEEYATDVGDSILAKDDANKLHEFAEKVQGILEILKRKSMKVAFFGRTSNGKSTVVNAMLKDKILPSGIGHTTNCFVQIEGVDGAEGYIKMEDGERRSVQSLSQLASALSRVRLTPESLIKICWPKRKCFLLQEDVVLVDSPGIDVSADVDGWIDKFCLDADVFVLVANAESTLMQAEKNFFHRVSSRLSKPNIFILNNRWDASAHEPETKREVKQQHLDRSTSFLVDELQVLQPSDIDRRVFFVSALETLQHNLPSRSPILRVSEGVEERLGEFSEFEKCFADCISKAAVETKFAQHVRNVEGVASSMTTLWADVSEKADQARWLKTNDFVELNSRLEVIERMFPDCRDFMKECIAEASDNLQAKMRQSIIKELKYLDNILDEYYRPFDPDNEEVMRIYKKDLNFFVEENLTKNLHIKYTPVAKSIFLTTCRNMIDAACPMTSMSQNEIMNSLTSAQEFEVIYSLDCIGLCSQFVEDVDFRFSLGLSALVGKCLGKSRADDQEMCQILTSSTSPSSLTPLNSGSTIGLLALLTVVTKTVGMRLIAMCATAYLAFYVYERLTWTNKAKELTFKRQYASFVTHQLRRITGFLIENSSQQTERELNFVMNNLCDMVANHQGSLSGDVHESKSSMEKLERASASAKTFRSKFENISRRLEEFRLSYLRPVA